MLVAFEDVWLHGTTGERGGTRGRTETGSSDTLPAPLDVIAVARIV